MITTERKLCFSCGSWFWVWMQFLCDFWFLVVVVVVLGFECSFNTNNLPTVDCFKLFYCEKIKEGLLMLKMSGPLGRKHGKQMFVV